jgi:predicted TIM-barrel fold metal-dependent hydrolase
LYQAWNFAKSGEKPSQFISGLLSKHVYETQRMTSDISQLRLGDFTPRSQLVVKKTLVLAPHCDIIDAHNHLGPDFGGAWSERSPQELLDRLDEAHVSAYIDLDGGWSEDILDARLRKFKPVAPERLIFFGGPGWKHWESDGPRFGEMAAKRFRAQVARGAQGLKIWKDFGLHVRDEHGVLVAVDDSRVDPLWNAASELKVPVVIHVADPVAFFDPLDATNERWDELHAHPAWQFPSPPFPSFLSIMDALARLVTRFPVLRFVIAHVGCYSENLGWVAALMDRCPNVFVDISARISELGRQPYSAKRFIERFSDRVLVGIDCGPSLSAYRTYYRFLETDDEYFNYDNSTVPQQGRWQIYGLNLSAPILENIYYNNAARLFGIEPHLILNKTS